MYSRTILIALCVFLLAPSRGSAAAAIERVNVSSSEEQANGGSTETMSLPNLSDDGSYVVFSSSATNLVPDDTNEGPDVFLRDLINGTTTRLSVSPTGAQAEGIPGLTVPFSYTPSISADGRYIVFGTTAENFFENASGASDGYIVLRDRLLGTMVAVTNPTIDNRGQGFEPCISADGNVVAFQSTEDGFVAGDTNMTRDIFVWTRTTGAYERISVTSGGGQISSNNYFNPRLNADGTLVVFSTFTDLVPNAISGSVVYLRNRLNGTTEIVSMDSAEVPVTGHSASISRDGRYITFVTATQLDAVDTNGTEDVYLRDRLNGTTELCSRKPDGALFNGTTKNPFISGNGRYVAFIGPGQFDSGGIVVLHDDLFVLDRQTGTVTEAGNGIAGDADAFCRLPSFSNNGQFLRFESSAGNLVANDTNFLIDVFLKDRSQEVSTDPVASPPFIRLTEGESTTVSVSPPASVANPNSIFKALATFNSSVVQVTPEPNVEVKPSGKNPAQFTFTAVGIGTTTVTIEFRNGPTGTAFTVSIEVTILGAADSSANNTQAAHAGDPINTRNGEYHALESVPMRLGGPMPLTLSIYHGSRLSLDARIEGTLGENRLHAFESIMTSPQPDRRSIVTNQGRVISFAKTKSAWKLTGRTDIPFQLAENGTEFVLLDPLSQLLWTYDAATGHLLNIADGRGNTHTLSYNGDNLLAMVADGLGRSLAFTYTTTKLTRVADHTGRHVDFAHTGAVLTSMTDPLNHTTTYAHDANGQLTSFTRPMGNSPFSQSYTGGRVTGQTERGMDTRALVYGTNSTTITDPAGGTQVHAYADSGELIAQTDEAGRASAVENDATGRRSSLTDRQGDATKVVYHALSGKPAFITNAEGRTVTMVYKARSFARMTFFDLTSVAFPDGAREGFTYDKLGNLITRVDRGGKKWVFTHNAHGQVLTAKNPLGGISTFTYDAAGNLATRQDPDTAASTYAYDALNRLTSVTRPGADTVSFTYDAADRVLSVTDERGNATSFAYDANNRLTGLTDANAKTTTYAYDVLDRIQQVTDRNGATDSVIYNSRQLLASATDRNGNVTSFAYDPRQRPVGIVDAGSQTWTTGFDDEGLVSSTKNPLDPPSTVKRNRLGRVIESSNSLGHTAQVARDVMQRVVTAFDPLGRATTFTYDKRGLLASATEQGTGTARYERDALGSVSKITDPNGGAWQFAYTKAGRQTGLVDPLGRKSARVYDERGRRAVTTFGDGTTLTRTYDEASNVTRRLFTDGTDLTFAYDGLNRLTATNNLTLSYDGEGRITNSAQGGENFGATYDAGGRLLTVTSPRNGGAFAVSYAYDTRNRLVSVGDNLSGATVGFTYDNAGRLLTMNRSNGVNRSHIYDAAGRLTRIQDGPFLDLQYALNAAGEVTTVDFTAPLIPSVPAATQAFTFDKASQITTTGYAYDARGRLTAAPGKTFAWDGAARLKTAAGVSLTYNGLNDVITRVAAAVTTQFFYNYALGLHPIVAEKIQGGAFTRHYVWTPAGRLLYAIDAATAQPVFFHSDRIGSTLALSDHTGAVTDAYAYSPYGEQLARTGTSTQPFTYVGTYGVRAEGGLHQMRARYYDPTTARFLSRDPIWPSLASPKRLNPYEYAAQSPGEFVDPDGHEPQPFKVNVTRADVDTQMAMFLFPHQVTRASWEHEDAMFAIEDEERAASFAQYKRQQAYQARLKAQQESIQESILDEIDEVIVGATFHANPEEFGRGARALADAAAALAFAQRAYAEAMTTLNAIKAAQKATAKPAGVGTSPPPLLMQGIGAGIGFGAGWSFGISTPRCPIATAREENLNFLKGALKSAQAATLFLENKCLSFERHDIPNIGGLIEQSQANERAISSLIQQIESGGR